MSIVYADTSAVLKRMVPEAESDAVRAHLRQCLDAGDLVLASSLTWLEVWRALRRLHDPEIQVGMRRTMSGIEEFPLDDGVLETARRIGGDSLRSLDAIHLASAVMMGAHSIMTFDVRLAEAARSAGIGVVAF